MSELSIRPVSESDRRWVRILLRLHFGSESMVVHGQIFYPAEQQGFIASASGKRIGLITLDFQGETCEITVLDALQSREEIFQRLLDAAKQACISQKCHHLRLVTTNDNTDALRIYQAYGFRLCALHSGAVDEARKIKPEIPLKGDSGIPIRDEIDLEMEIGTR